MKPWQQHHLYGQQKIDEYYGKIPPNPDTVVPDFDSFSEAELIAFAEERHSESAEANAAKSQAERTLADNEYLTRKATEARLAKFGAPPAPPVEYPPNLPTYDEFFAQARELYPYLSPDVIRRMVSAAYPSSPVLDRPPGGGSAGRVKTFEKGLHSASGSDRTQETTHRKGQEQYDTEQIFGKVGEPVAQRQCQNCGNFGLASLVSCEHCGALF